MSRDHGGSREGAVSASQKLGGSDEGFLAVGFRCYISEAGRERRRVPHCRFQMLHGLANNWISESRTLKGQVCVAFSHSLCDTFFIL